ncbi:hypothetical protein BurJ1DRAFT_0071 [Burkholderiales bacterium JOSHI_001]|nr:hypothetical protein BurJ1DRAFT_0071 [Burkholderiales bacterium JOSHI_001]
MSRFHTLAALTLSTTLLAACGGGDDAPAAGGAAAAAATCNQTLFQPGFVEQPTADQLSAYAGTYNGDEGAFGPNLGDPFVKSGSASLVVSASGGVTYKGTSYATVSVCIDKAAGNFGKVMYVHTDKGHFDISTQSLPDLGQAWGISPVDGQTNFRNSVKQ